jgi:hypothetical protein
MATIYRERKAAWLNSTRDIASDIVEVRLRRWSNTDAQDYVIESLVVVDGDRVIHNAEVETGYKFSDAAMIRRAIALFDSLLVAHPNKEHLQ